MHALTLTVDSRNRICLSRLFPEEEISSVKAYRKNDKIVLEPLVEIPASEVWLYKNKEALKKVKKGLTQKGTIAKGSFAKYAKDDI